MQTKRRLRILATAAAALLMACGSLSAVYADSSAAEESALPGPFQASEAFVAEAGANPSGQWTWGHYATEQVEYNGVTYAANAYEITNKNFYKTTFDAADFPYPAGTDKVANSFINSSDGEAIGKYWMRALRANDSSLLGKVSAVRTFTAPEGGNVTISAVDINGNSAILGSNSIYAADNRGVRIVREKVGGGVETIWPAKGDADTKELEDGRLYAKVPRKGSLPFPSLTLNISKGDKLHFELANIDPATGDTRYACTVYWDPAVRYNALVAIEDFQPSVTDDLPLNQVFTIITEDEPEPITAGNVSVTGTTAATVRDFSFEGNTISFAFDGLAYSGTYEVEVRGLKPLGSSGVGETYRFSFTTITLKQYQASDYYDAAGKNNPLTLDGEAPWTWESYDLKTEAYTTLSSFNSSRGYAVVGGWNAVTAVDSSAMYGDTRQDGQGGFKADETYTYAWQRYYPVRTFTVPESGKVTLSAAGDVITAPDAATPNLRILLERNGEFIQLWPENGWKAVNASAPVHFTPLVQNVTVGDKLHFELSAADAGTGNCWNMCAYWDPIVSYNEKHPTVTEISPESGAVDVPGNTEFVVTFAEEICEPSVNDVMIENGAVADVWLENGNEIHIILDGAALKEKTTYTMRLKNIRLKNMDEQNSFEQLINFTTGSYTMYGEFSLSGAELTLPVNNTTGSVGVDGKPVYVTVIAVLCQGTPENYTVRSAQYVTKCIENRDLIKVTLSEAPADGEFVKAVAVTVPNFGKPTTDMAILR